MAGERWVALSLLAIAVVLTAATLSPGDASSAGTVGASTGLGRARPLPSAVDGLVAIPGFALRDSASAVVDGSLLLLNGSAPDPSGIRDDRSLGKGVLVAADGRTVRTIPDAPFDVPIYDPQAVAVDGQVVVVGVECAKAVDEDGPEPYCEPGTRAGAVLNLRDGGAVWRRVAVPWGWNAGEGGALGVGATSGGTALFERFIGARRVFWELDVEKDEWRRLPDLPAGAGDASGRACLVGGELVSQSLAPGSGGSPVASAPASGGGISTVGGVPPRSVINTLDVRGGRSWTSSAPSDPVVATIGGSPIVGSGLVLGCMDGGVMVAAWGQPPATRVYSLREERWSTPPPPPRGMAFTQPVWTGSELVLVPHGFDDRDRGANSYQHATGTWLIRRGIPDLLDDPSWNGTAIVGPTAGACGADPARRPMTCVSWYVVPR